MPEIPLSDCAWRRVSHLFPEVQARRFGKTARHPREILNAILWVAIRHEHWSALPPCFPPASTCYIKSLQWRRAGLIDEVLAILERHCKD